MLEKFAQIIDRNPYIRHIYFLVCAILSIACIGYYFGTFDQAIHIPFLRAAVDETLFPGDAFIDLRHTHYSYFWVFFRPLLQAGILEVSMFVLHVLATYLTFWAVWSLSNTLFNDRLASCIATLALVPVHIFFAGFPIIEFSLLNRTFVLPFLLFALNDYLRGKYVPAFLLLGLMYNLHVVSVNFAMAMVLFASVIEIRKVGWRNLLLGLICFVAAASPVLFWKANSTPLDLSLRPEWLNVLQNGQLYHLFHIAGPYLYTLGMAAANFSSLALFVIAYAELLPPPADPQASLWQRAWADIRRFVRAEAPSPARTGLLFFIAMVLVVLVEEICAYFLPVTIIIQSQIIRAGVMAALLGYLYFSAYLAKLYRAPAWRSGGFIIQIFAFVAGSVAAWPVITWALLKWIPLTHRRRAWLGGIIAGSLAIMLGAAFYMDLWQPGIYMFGPKNAWQDAQEWARDNTPKDAIFITPPEIWWMYESDWRVFSERSTISTLAELLEAAFDPSYTHIWQERFEAIAPGAQSQFHGDFLQNLQTTRRAYYSLSTEQIQQVACRYNASYLVVDFKIFHDLPAVYENTEYRIYHIPPGNCPAK